MDEPLPKVTPYLLRRAGTMCAQRLAKDCASERGSSSPVNRGRVRDAFLDAARTNHAELRAPSLEFFAPPASLLPEEVAVFRHAANWYVELFGDHAVRVHLNDCDTPTLLPRRGVRAGGWVDLTVEDADGKPELRQLRFWSQPLPSDVLDDESTKLAVLRLSRWVGARPLTISLAHLVSGDLRERVVEPERIIPGLRDWFDERTMTVLERIAEPEPTPGGDCGGCRHVGTCPAYPNRASADSRRGDLRPGIITLTPSSLERWRRCVREWRTADLLQVPASDARASPDHGLLVHMLLHQIHVTGSCQNPSHVAEVLGAYGVEGSGAVRNDVRAHTRRCPVGAEAFDHEFTAARFHRRPYPLFMATARLDAAWIHDGVLDVRDYKTGRMRVDRVADDPLARLQAWVLSPLAVARGLALRVRWEFLAAEHDDDPEPFDPDADDLAAIETELTDVVRAMWAEESFAGVADPGLCGSCQYRSICPDSAAPTEPSWPVVEPEAVMEDIDA